MIASLSSLVSEGDDDSAVLKVFRFRSFWRVINASMAESKLNTSVDCSLLSGGKPPKGLSINNSRTELNKFQWLLNVVKRFSRLSK